VPEPLASPVDADKDRLIADLTDLTQAQAAKIAFLQSAYDSAHTAAIGFQSEAASLRIAVTALQGQPRWDLAAHDAALRTDQVLGDLGAVFTYDVSGIPSVVPPTSEKRDVTEAEIRGTCNRLMAAGINTITSYYSFNGLSASRCEAKT